MVRIKHRYLVVHILYPTQIGDKTSSKAITSNVLQFHRPSPASVDIPLLLRLIRGSVEYMYGDYGAGLIASSLKIVYFSQATSTAIIRVAAAHYRILWAGVTWITHLGKTSKRNPVDGGDGESCVFRVVRTCGTIRKAQDEVVRRAKEEIKSVKAGERRERQDALPVDIFGTVNKSSARKYGRSAGGKEVDMQMELTRDEDECSEDDEDTRNEGLG